MELKNNRFHKYPKTKAQDLKVHFYSTPPPMTYTCNYGTSSSSFKYTLKNFPNHQSVASELKFSSFFPRGATAPCFFICHKDSESVT